MKNLKGYFLLDALFSISIIIILATFIIPAIMNNIYISNKNIRKQEDIKLLQNEMERIVGENYHNKDYRIDNSSNNSIICKSQSISEDLVLVELSTKENNNEVKFKIILKKGGFYTN